MVPDWRVTLPENGLSLDEFEQDMIRQALIATHGRRTHAARLLGLTRHALNYRVEKHGLESDTDLFASSRLDARPLNEFHPKEI